MYLRPKIFGIATPREIHNITIPEVIPLCIAFINIEICSGDSTFILIIPKSIRYISTPGIIGMTEGIVNTWLGQWNQCTAFIAIRLTNTEPANEPITSPMSRPILSVLGPRFTKLRVHTAMIPPIATTHNRRRGILKIMENPIAEIAAAMAYSIYV